MPLISSKMQAKAEDTNDMMKELQKGSNRSLEDWKIIKDNIFNEYQPKQTIEEEMLINLVRALENTPEFTAYLLKDNAVFKSWYQSYKRKEKKRLEQEAREQEIKRLKKQALDKLSPEEKAALGL